MAHRRTGLMRGYQSFALGCALAAGGLALAQPSFAQEKVLRVGVGELSKAKGNPYVGSGFPHIYVWAALYDALVDVDTTGTPTPLLAESWRNINPTTWRITLKPNVQFHNGKPLTSRAIVDMFAYLATEDGRKTVRGAAANAAGIDKVNVIDDRTFEITTKAGNAILPTLLSNFDIPEPQHFAEIGADGVREKPVGTGPFALGAWSSNNARLVQFPSYFGGKPKVDVVIIEELPEAAARRDALISNQIHIDVAPSLDDAKVLRNAGAKLDVSPASNVTGITPISSGQTDGKGKTTPFADKRVRAAFNLSIDRDGIIRDLTEGLAAHGNQAATTGTFGYNPNVPKYRHDPAEAKKLMVEAGYPNGFKMKVPILTQDPLARLIYERSIDGFRQAGVDSEVVGVNLAEWLKHFITGTFIDNGFIAFGGGHALNPEMDASAALGKYSSCKKRPEAAIHYCDEAEAKLLDLAANEFDSDKRKAILQTLMQLNHDNNALALAVSMPRLMAHSSRVTGFKQAFTKIYYAGIGLN